MTVLVTGGGDGFGSLEKIVDAVALGTRRFERAIGRDLRAQRGGETKAEKSRVATGGWRSAVSDMNLYMEASDVLLTKAGPGTIAEAAALGLPVLLTGFLPGQERR